jgi:hypothetical protein
MYKIKNEIIIKKFIRGRRCTFRCGYRCSSRWLQGSFGHTRQIPSHGPLKKIELCKCFFVTY